MPPDGNHDLCPAVGQYLQLKGYKACYVEVNATGFVEQHERTFNTVHDTYLGKVTFENVEMYYRQEKLLDVLKQEYDYFVYDFGTYMDTDFSKTSFLEKDVRIFVVGSKASEMSYTNELIRNEYYTDVNYVFNFISEKEKPELLEYMEERQTQTYFTVSTPDQFEYVPNEAFEKLLPVEDISEPEEEPRGFFRKKKGKKKRGKSKERQERGNGMGKFKKTLVSAAKADLAQEQEQKRLRKKHHVEEEGLLIVERDNLLKFFVRCLASMVRIGATIFLFLLAAIGLVSLVYPEVREVLLRVLYQIGQELFTMLR